jgi:NTP pyrophosphatase (non-canonical NTP hydrolase)
MHFREYQLKAGETDQSPAHDERGILIPLLGLAGEVGTLLAEYKKHLRDGNAHLLFKEQMAEELGDLLWYLADVATKFDLDLGEIAAANLKKTQNRWPSGEAEPSRLFDEDYPDQERLPRRFEVLIREERIGDKVKVRCWLGDKAIGDPLTDNAYEDDGYRFHDVFHLAHAAILGWSPMMRSLLKRKRKSKPKVDEVEDGARAKIVEEAISAIVYDYARKHDYLAGVQTLDYPLLKTIQGLVSDREVRACSLYEWQKAILAGYRVWRQVRQDRGGVVVCDLARRTLEYRQATPPPEPCGTPGCGDAYPQVRPGPRQGY